MYFLKQTILNTLISQKSVIFLLKTVGILLAAAIVKYFKAKRGFLALWLCSSLCEAVILSVAFQNEMFFIHTRIKWIFKVW